MAGGLENGKKLSDFPEFSEHIKRMAAFRKTTERFWVEGLFRDDIGLQFSGAFAKIYQTDREVAIMAANLGEEASTFKFDLDASRYGINRAMYSLISSNGTLEEDDASRHEGVLHGSRSLEPFEMAAFVFVRVSQ